MPDPAPCQCCGATIPEREIEPIGIMYDERDEPCLVLHNCGCGTTRALRWWTAPAWLRAKAAEAEMERKRAAG